MEEIKQIKQKWYQNKYTWIFIIILLAAIGLRFYYYTITENQPLWWDESDYMSAAKTYAGHGFADLTGQRLPGLPLLASLLFQTGMQNEALIRFCICFIPSIIMLILLYLAISKMYADKRIALISMAIMAFLTESLFYSNRFQTENLGLIFQFLSIIFMYSFLNKKNAFYLVLTGAMALLSVFFRPGQMLFIPAMVLFLIITQWKEHKIIVTSLIALMVLAATGIMMYVPSLNYIIMSNMNASNIGPAWNSLTVFNGLLGNVFSIFLYIGIVITLFTFRKEKSDIFNLLTIITVLSAFIFVIRAPAYEYRWFFPLIIAALVLTAKCMITLIDGSLSLLFKSPAKAASIAVIILLLIFGVYSQIATATMLINIKANTYADVRSAGLWIKDNSAKNDVIFSISYPQTAYYSERKVMSYAELNNSAQFDDFIIQNNPRWFTVSIYEPHPLWIYEWLDKNQPLVFPAAAYFTDAAQTKAALIIYGFRGDPRNWATAENNSNISCTEDSCAA